MSKNTNAPAAIEIEWPQSPEGQAAAVRSSIYRSLADAFQFPSAPGYELMESGKFLEQMAAMCSALPFEFPLSPDNELGRGLVRVGAPYGDFEANYISVFDVGAAGPPCPLFGGQYTGGSRMKVLEDLVRCYEFFGLKPGTEGSSEFQLPDHITVELEFMHYLSFNEIRALQSEAGPLPYRRAQRDFLQRHPCAWIPMMRERLATCERLPFFDALVGLTEAFVRADFAFLDAFVEATASPDGEDTQN